MGISPLEKDNDGFSLLEVLIALVVLAVGFLGLSSMTIGTTETLSYSKNLTTATTLARWKMEQIKNARYKNITAANYPTEAYGSIAEHPRFQRTVTINDNTPAANMKTITVTVSWRGDGSSPHSVTLTTIIAES
jgi:type IV pilus assembly protein PilV